MKKTDLKRFLYEPVAMTSMDWLIDCVIALGVFGFGVVQLALTANLFVPDPFTRMILGISRLNPDPAGIIATLFMSAIVVFRRRFPWPCFALTLFLWLIVEAALSMTELSMAPVLVCIFTLAYERGDTQTIVASAISIAVIVFAQFFTRTNALSSLLFFQNACLIAAVAFAGNAIFARQGRMAALEAHALEVEHAKEAEASKRVEEERVRIARELHDITAHSLSAIGIQAAVAERMIGKNDEEASVAIKQVRSISKAALADMRAIVGVLRGTSTAETAPIMGTSDLAILAEYLQGFEIECDIEFNGYDERNVPSHVDVALFKIAREAVTNAARHSGAKKVKILLALDGFNESRGDIVLADASCNPAPSKKQAILIVADDGSGIAGEQLSVGGHGLSGMRERAKVLGGSMKVLNNANDFEFEGREMPRLADHGTTIEVRIPV